MSTSRVFHIRYGMYYINFTAMFKETTFEHSNVICESTQKKNTAVTALLFPNQSRELRDVEHFKLCETLWRESLKKNFSPRKQKSSLVSLLCCYSPSLRSLVGKWRQQSRSVPGGASRGCHQWSWEFPHLPTNHTTECSRLFKTIQERSSFPMDFFQIVSVWPCF